MAYVPHFHLVMADLDVADCWLMENGTEFSKGVNRTRTVCFLIYSTSQHFMGNLLYTIAVILVIIWALGFFGFGGFGMGGLIHALLVIAVIAVLFRLISGRGV